MRTFLIILSVIGACYATSTCQELHKSQLASLSERMNQMLSSLYAPLASKTEANITPPTAEISSPVKVAEQASLPYSPYFPFPYSMPMPQVVYVTPTQYQPQPVPFIPPVPVEPRLKPFKSPIVQPLEYAYPGPMDVSPWPNYYDQYPYMQYPPVAMPYKQLHYPPPYPYPEYPVYPNIPSYPPYQSPPPPMYPPPPPYPLPPMYNKASEIPPAPYY